MACELFTDLLYLGSPQFLVSDFWFNYLWLKQLILWNSLGFLYDLVQNQFSWLAYESMKKDFCM